MSRKFTRFMVAVDASTRPKVKRLKRAGTEVRWAWFHGVLPIAAQAPVRGCFLVGDLPADEHDVAEMADVTLAQARKALEVGRGLGMLYRDDELGCERVHDWDEVNPAPKQDKTAAERQQRRRDRIKADRDALIVTPASRRDARDGHGAVTPPEVEGEVEVQPTALSGQPDGDVDKTTEQSVPANLDEARTRLKSADVQTVFDAWITATGRTGRTVLDPSRRRKIQNALKVFPVDDLVAAVHGWRHSPHHRGENATSTVYNDLDLLLRDAAHVEKFRDLERGTTGALAEESPAARAARWQREHGGAS